MLEQPPGERLYSLVILILESRACTRKCESRSSTTTTPMLLFNRKALLAQSGLSAPTLPPNNLAMLTVRKPKLVGDEQVPTLPGSFGGDSCIVLNSVATHPKPPRLPTEILRCTR